MSSATMNNQVGDVKKVLSPSEQKTVVIVGGSLAGLLNGIALRNLGHHVRILEQADDERESHMAGVCLGVDGRRYIEQHDRHPEIPFTLESDRIQLLSATKPPRYFTTAPRIITSWDTLYYRLRSSFDGYTSDYYPTAPAAREGDGSAVYEARKRVVRVRHGDIKTSPGVDIDYEDLTTNQTHSIHADLVIAADGPNSTIRNQYLPACKRVYNGYVAWRGVVLESNVSAETRASFQKQVNVHLTNRRDHCLVYLIPGKNGSLKPGERLLNFLWYTNETPERLDQILKDKVTSHRHHNLVPAGRIRDDIWQRQLDDAALLPLPPMFLETIRKIERPFVQVITDFTAPQAAFAEGRVLLVGDGMTLLRPHTAFSGTQASFHALQVADYVKGELSVEQWQRNILRLSYLQWVRVIWWGAFYQNRWGYALATAARFYFWLGVEKMRSLWSGKESLIRI